MKKIILSTSFLLLFQLGNTQVNIGARMGMNMGFFELKKVDVEEYSITPRPNILLNMDADVPFSMVFSFRTGLGFVQKWSEIDHVPDMKHVDTTWSLLYKMTYLEVPLFLVARGETEYYGNFYFGAGPTLSLGVGGKMEMFAKSISTGKERQETIDLVWNSKPAPENHHGYDYFKRFDLGLGFIFAYQLPKSGLTFTASYNKGLRNISPNPGTEFRTSYVGVSIGFFMQN
ncbi:MAG: PorT family protein [Bacteroidales bacterium]|nr:PorT family protein [Bacteroidales bacterium]